MFKGDTRFGLKHDNEGVLSFNDGSVFQSKFV